MVDKDIIFEKVKNIQNCLKRIQKKTKGNPETLSDLDVEDIFVLNLQRAVQSTIDLAAHVVSDEGLGLPSDLRENFLLLEKAKIIPKKLSAKLQKMVGFRNIAVHDYTAIEVKILQAVLQDGLQDLEEFYAILLRHFKLADK